MVKAKVLPKEHRFVLAKIKISKLCDVVKENNCTSFLDKIFLAEVDNGLTKVSFNDKNLNGLFRKIKEEVRE